MKACRHRVWRIATTFAVVSAAGLSMGCPAPESSSSIVVQGNPATVASPEVALDGNGQATILYRDTNVFQPRAQTYRFSEGRVFATSDLWASVQPRPNQGASISNGLSHVLAMDESGQAIAVTQRLARTQLNQSSRDYTLFGNGYSSSGWSGAEELNFFEGKQGESERTREFALAMNGTGRTLAIYRSRPGTADEIHARRFVPGSGWEAPQTLSNATTGVDPLTHPDVVYWGSGVGHAAWLQNGALMVSRFIDGTSSWEASQQIAPANSTDPLCSPRLALHRRAGNEEALLVWLNRGGAIHYSRALPGGGWQPPQPIPGGGGASGCPQISMSQNSDAIAAWTAAGSVWAGRFANGSWESATELGTGGMTRVAMDAPGNAIALWRSGESVVARAYRLGTGWQASMTIGRDLLAETEPALAMDDSGRGIGVWMGAKINNVDTVRTYVFGAPTAQATFTPLAPVVGQPVTFNASGSTDADGSIVSYEWDFDNNGTVDATGVNATRTFSAAGDQRVRLVVRDNVGLGASTDLVVPVSPPGSQPSTLTVTVSGNGVVTSNPGGISCGTDCNEDYPSGTRVDLTPVPNAGHAFERWTGDSDCGDGSVFMNVNKNCEAIFVPLERVAVTVVGNGVVTSIPNGINCPPTCEAQIPQRTGVRLNPVPDPGWQFIDFSGDADCTDGLLVVDGPRSCTATFQPVSAVARLDLTVTGPGEVRWPDSSSCQPGPVGICSQMFPTSTVVALVPVDGANGKFSTWGGDCAPFGTIPTINVTLTRNFSCTATFTAAPPIGFDLELGATIIQLNATAGTGNTSVIVTRTTYLDAVDLRADDCPSNVQCVFADNPLPRGLNATTITFTANNATPGNYVVTVRGNGGGTIREDTIELQVQ